MHTINICPYRLYSTHAHPRFLIFDSWLLSYQLCLFSFCCCCGHDMSPVLCPPRWMTRREACSVGRRTFLHTAQPQNAHGLPWSTFVMNILWDDSDRDAFLFFLFTYSFYLFCWLLHIPSPSSYIWTDSGIQSLPCSFCFRFQLD